jgi:3-deoxy-D-manno-octulosonic-acid transferase
MTLRWFLPLYALLWHIGLPLAVAYLWWRGRKDPLYAQHLAERFGRYARRMQGGVWVHAVSLGEVRSAVPIIRALLSRGERVVVTHFTPAGRRETERALAPEIAAGQVSAVWVPFETSWAYSGFFRAFHPRAGLVMEVEHWPRMILAARAHGVPLYPANAQYPLRSFTADCDRRRWRFQVIGRYAGALVKSELQAERFRATGLTPVEVTGETRFDQPIPGSQVQAGIAARAWIGAQRVVTIASAVEGEDALYISIIKSLQADPATLFVYVPRRPERFAEVHATLVAAGLRIAARSATFDADLASKGAPPQIDVLLGDSLGEMYFYLAMADRAVVGGGFTDKGAHNIIEPLALGKPVLTGPVTWPIEYPFAEAQAAGLARSVPDASALAEALAHPQDPTPEAIAAFVSAHSGAAARTIAALDRFTSR